MGKPLTVAILDGAHQVAVPALAATLTICIVFFPVVLLDGAGALPVRAARALGRVLDDRVVPAVAHAGADAGAPAARGSSERTTAPSWRASTRWRDRQLRAPARRATRGVLGVVHRAPRACSRRGARSSSRRRPAAGQGRRLRLLSRRSTPGRCGCTCARPSARASRTPRAIVAPVEARDPPHHPARTSSTSSTT